MKTSNIIREETEGNYVGTVSLTKKYRDETPGQQNMDIVDNYKYGGQDLSKGNPNKVESKKLKKFKQLVKESEEEKNAETYKKWKSLVNMSADSLEKYINSDTGKKSGLSRSEASSQGISSGRDSARAIVKMLRKGKENWNASDWKWANKQVSFISRMKGNDGPLKDKDGNLTRKAMSLKIWGHNPL